MKGLIDETRSYVDGVVMITNRDCDLVDEW